jgi:hypothetical protein
VRNNFIHSFMRVGLPSTQRMMEEQQHSDDARRDMSEL